MNILQLIQLVVALVGKGLPVPDLKDKPAVEAWLVGLSGPLAAVIALLASREGIVGSELPVADLEAECRRVCDEQEAEIDPATIIAIITVIIKLVQFWRSRRS